jgi:hypothetical protein
MTTALSGSELIAHARAELTSGSPASQSAWRLLSRWRLSDQTVEHFGLGLDTSKSSAGRLLIPRPELGDDAYCTRAIVTFARCGDCGERVTPVQMANRQHEARRAQSETDWRRCPHCNAASSRARLAWLISQHPKYLLPKGLASRDKLYGDAPTAEALQALPEIALCEGYPEVWALHEAGIEHACAYNSRGPSTEQLQQLGELQQASGHIVRITIFPSYDLAGRQQLPEIVGQLSRMHGFEVAVARWAPANDHTTGREEKSVPVDAAKLLQHWGAEAVQAAHQHAWSQQEWAVHHYSLHSERGASLNKQAGATYALRTIASSSLLAQLDSERLDQLSRTGWMQHLPEVRDRVASFVQPFDQQPAQQVDEAGDFVQLDHLLSYLRESGNMPPVVLWKVGKKERYIWQIESLIARHAKAMHRPVLFTHERDSTWPQMAHLASTGGVLVIEREGGGSGFGPAQAAAQLAVEAISEQGLDPAQWQIIICQSPAAAMQGHYGSDGPPMVNVSIDDIGQIADKQPPARLRPDCLALAAHFARRPGEVARIVVSSLVGDKLAHSLLDEASTDELP